MYKMNRWFVATAGAAVLGLAFSATNAGHAFAAGAGQLLNVVVTNPVAIDQTPGANNVVATIAGTPTVQVGNASLAVTAPSGGLPVTLGSATVPVTAPPGGLPVSFPSTQNVNATVNGTPNVTVDASQSFAQATSTFAGGPRTPVVVVNAYEGRQPFYASISAHENLGNSFAQSSLTLNTGGKRLVIEYLSVTANADAGHAFASMEFSIQPQSNGVSGTSLITPVKLGSDGLIDFYQGNQLVKMYADDGSILHFGMTAFNGNNISFQYLSGGVAIHGYLIDP